MLRILTFSALLTASALAGCSGSHYQANSLQYSRYDIKPSPQSDTSVLNMLAPYSKEIGATMNKVIGKLTVTLEKKQPDNSLGFFMTDALMAESARQFNTKVDLAFMNYGGIRMNAMQPGNITVGSIYEIMPFDNLAVILTLTGKQLEQLFQHIAGRGGWPLSGGTYSIENKKATHILIGGAVINPDAQYVVALSDYVANGGDDCSFLKTIPQQNRGYLQRDAIIDYVKSITAAGKTIDMPVMNRVQMLP